MAVTVHPAPRRMADDLVERWRVVPAAVAVDLGPDIGRVDPAIRPLMPPGRQPRLFGRAVTAVCDPPDFGAVLHAADLIEPGDVLVIAAQGRPDTAMIGEIVSGHLRRRGAVGFVCDGASRDVGMLAGWTDFSVFTRHIAARGPSSAERGAVNRPVAIGGVIVAPGDLIIGDDDGLAVLSPTAVATRIGDALAKLEREVGWEASLASGRSARETFGLAAPVPAPR